MSGTWEVVEAPIKLGIIVYELAMDSGQEYDGEYLPKHYSGASPMTNEKTLKMYEPPMLTATEANALMVMLDYEFEIHVWFV